MATQVEEDRQSHNRADFARHWARYMLFRIVASSWEDLPAVRHIGVMKGEETLSE